MDDFDCTTAGRAIADYVEELSNWYVRLNRRRFWEGDAAAFATLRHCLVEVTKLLAPLTPFLADSIYCNLVAGESGEFGDAPDSVHLADFPEADQGARRPRARGGDGGGAPHRRARPRGARPLQGQDPPAASQGGRGRHRRGAPGDRAPRRHRRLRAEREGDRVRRRGVGPGPLPRQAELRRARPEVRKADAPGQGRRSRASTPSTSRRRSRRAARSGSRSTATTTP